MNDPAALLTAFDGVMSGTARALARVPADHLDFRPHPRSWTVRELATHLARLPSWTRGILERDAYDLAPNEAPGATGPPPAATLRGIVELFEQNVGAARAGIATASLAALAAPWSLRRGGTTLRTMSRGEALREFVLDHSIHHRGQLTVSLRLLDVPVPALFGPNADERG